MLRRGLVPADERGAYISFIFRHRVMNSQSKTRCSKSDQSKKLTNWRSFSHVLVVIESEPCINLLVLNPIDPVSLGEAMLNYVSSVKTADKRSYSSLTVL